MPIEASEVDDFCRLMNGEVYNAVEEVEVLTPVVMTEEAGYFSTEASSALHFHS